MPAATIELTSTEWQAFRASAARDSGGLVPVFGPPPELFSTFEVTVTIAGDRIASFSGQVVNLFGSDVALLLDADALKKIEDAPASGAWPVVPLGESETQRATDASGPGAFQALDSGASPKVEEAPTAPNERGSKRDRAGRDSPVWKRYQEMTRVEKIKVARGGNEAERRAVLKDRDSSLHHFVLNNPNMKPKELAALIRGGGVSGAFLKKLCERHDFLSNRAVAEALVVNPQTPVDVAVRLVGRIPVELCRRIARSTNYRPQVVNAAKKRVLDR